MLPALIAAIVFLGLQGLAIVMLFEGNVLLHLPFLASGWAVAGAYHAWARKKWREHRAAEQDRD